MLFSSVENKLQILISLNSSSHNSPFLTLQPLSVTRDYVLHKYLQLLKYVKSTGRGGLLLQQKLFLIKIQI